jgi:hypothetical protein
MKRITIFILLALLALSAVSLASVYHGTGTLKKGQGTWLQGPGVTAVPSGIMIGADGQAFRGADGQYIYYMEE